MTDQPSSRMSDVSREALSSRCRQLISDWLKGLEVGPRTASEAVGEELGITTAVAEDVWRRALDYEAATRVSKRRGAVERAIGCCETEAQELMLMGLILCGSSGGDDEPLEWAFKAEWEPPDWESRMEVVTIRPQVSVLGEPVDFLISSHSGEPPAAKSWMVVQCSPDSNSPGILERRETQRARDKALRDHGYLVERFAEEEILRDFIGCAARAIRLLREDRASKNPH
jgi:hypothetical protein